MYQSHFLIKLQPCSQQLKKEALPQVLLYKICEIIKNIYFVKYFQTDAFAFVNSYSESVKMEKFLL